jgi:predicted CxxxxCH...CXXCH cytochrome family protein
MHNVQIGVAGGRNCTNCHDIGGSAPKHINVSAFNRSIHANLNNNTDPGSGIPNVTTACWACHGDGTDPGNSHPSNYKNPYTCSDCHVQGGANYGKYPNAKNVSEHYNNGADVNVSKLTGDVDSSCAYCHYGKSEMLLSASEINDPDTVSWSIYSGYNGGNNSASHYGKKRFVSGDGLYTAGGYTNCSYCHQNTATNFADAMENLNNINLYNHTNRTGGPYCTNSTCHGSGRIHDAILTKPYLNSTHQSGGMYNSTLCISCHANRRVHADAGDINANTLECASCHANPTAYSASGGGAGYFSISYDRVVMRDTDGSYSGNGSPSEAMVGDPASAKISSNIEPTVKTGGLLDKIGKWFSSGINSAKALLDNIEKELFKPSIEIVNPESRPRLGGEWEVYFKTKGSGVLEIRDHSFPEEVGFIALLYKKIGDQWIPVPIEISGDLIRAQWNHGEGKAIFKPLTTGKHTVELKFGNYAYAYNYVEPEVNFDRRLEGLKTGQHKVPPTTEIEITITATVSSTVENAILRDYVPKDFTIIKTYGGTIKEYNSEYNVIEWEVGTVNKSISKKYTVYSPERTIPPTKYYFYSELSHDGGSRTSDKWRVTVADPNTLIIRPNADGTLNDWSIGGTSPPANRWEAVDETTQNDDTDYVYATSQNLDQFFNLQDHTTETGTIDNVTVYIYAKQTTGNEYLQVCIWDNTYCQNTPTISTSYTLYSYSWTTDPSDSLAWTWSDIDALEAGVRSKNSGGWGGEIRVTQLYVEISYTPAAADNPPTWRNQMQNVSTINVSGAVNLSAQGNDDNGLWQAYLETNESGGTWANITDGTYGSPITLNNVTSWTWTNFTWSNSSIGPGTSIGWRIWYKDNATTPQWNVTDIMTFDVVDEVPPVITSKSINESGSVTVDTYVCINTTVTDNWQLDKVWSVLTYPNGTTENVSLANTGVPCASGDTYGAEVNVGSTQGTFYFNASYANDTSGNIGSNTTVQSLTVTSVDNTPPYNISFIPPTPDNATTLPSTQNWTTINVTVEDASSSIDTCLLEWNGTNESMTIDGSGLSVYCWSNKTDLSNGVYGYRVYANDSSGNINVSEYREVTIAYTPTYKQIYRYYVKFDISSIPQGATVNAANLTVNVTRAASGAIGVVNRTTGDYDSTSGNDTVWADSSGTKSSGGTFDASTTGLKNITITEAVQAAVNEGEGFVAFVITELNEDADQNFTIAGSQSGWPKLYINYSTNPQKQIHGIRYIRKDGTYSTPYDSSNVANCTSCHQGNIASVNGTSTPQIPSSITHSNGSKWNTSPGYWDATNNLSACLYCHGNTTHNDTALGNASQGLVDTNYVNGSINTTSYWCSGCHREDYANYYGDTLYPIPPTINASGNYYPSSGSPIDHTGFIASDSSDSKCFECHKGSLTGDPKIDVFLHKVSEGRAGGENCTTCHDLGGSAPSLLNISAFREGVHAGLNNYSSDLGPNSGSSADTINYACWACHGNGSSPGSQHPSNYKSPYNCTSCHLESGSRAGVFYGARNVTEHFKEGEDIQAATSYPNNITSCLSCHNKSEMILYNGNVGDPDFGGFSDTDGDGVVGGNYSFYHYGKNRTSDLVVNGYTNCSYCHQDASDSFGAPDVTEHTEVGVNVSVTKTCVNSDCHNSGRIHDATLKIRTDIAPWTSGANDRCAPCHNSTGPGSSIVIYNHTSSVSGITDCSYCHDSNAKGSGGSYLILHNSSLQQPYDSSSYQCSNCHQNAEDDYNARDIYAHSNSSSSTLNVNGSDCGRCHKTDYSAFTAGDNLHNSTLIKPSETQCTECHQSASDSVSAVDVYEHTTAAAANGRDINISRECTDSGCHWNGTGSTPTMLHNDTLEVKTIYEFNPSNSDVDRCAPCHNSSSSWSTINVTDHTPRATGPSCVNSTCHSGQKLHTDSIKKPATMFNDSLCLECHSDRQQHASYDLPEVADSNNLNCTDCHANWQSSEKQIHGINNSYLQQDLASYGANTTAVNCTSCHTNSTAVINGTSAPYIGSSLRHSNNESAGQLWGDYWNDTDSVLSNDSCYYCHGDTKHNATALGYVSILNVDNNYVNGSVNGTSQWCRSCHYNDSTSIYKGNNFSPRPPEITNDTGEFYNRNPSGYELHTGSSYLGNDSTCSNCHKASSEDDPGMDRFVHNVKIGVAGGRNCTSCHYLGSSNAPKHLNLSAMNISDNAHYMLNNRSGDPGTTDTSGSDWNNRRCWACHSNGTNPADSHNKTKYKSPWTCPDCHLSSGAMNSVFNWSAAGLSNVSEHYRSGSDIQATAFEASDLESCLNCHEYRDDISQPMSEMLIPNVNDPDYGSFTGDGVRPSETGGNYSFYHYGKKRFKSGDGLYTAGGYTNCSYCHQNSSTGFDFTDTKSYLKSIEQHTTRQQINCTNSTCHNSGRIHDSTLQKPTLSISNDTICVTCHGSRERHAGSVNCTQCHTNTSKDIDIHPIKYLLQNNTFSTSNSSAVNCTTCHTTSAITGTNNLDPPRVPQLNHSNGSKWSSTPYWNDSAGSMQNSSCYYCHGDTKHNSTALGKSSGAQQAWDYINGTINTTSTWCQDCHYNGSSNYIGSLFSPAPPEITNATGLLGSVSGYFNHSLGSYNDSACFSCHGNNTLGDKLDEFMHNISIGKASGSNPKNCTSCHALPEEGGSGAAPKTINRTAFNSTYSIHRLLNRTESGDENTPCWACHGNGTAPSSDMNHSTWPNLKNPKACPACHDQGNFSAPVVYKHSPTSSAVTTTAECESCHNNSMITNTGDTATNWTALVSHYGTNQSLKPGGTYNTTKCINCHKKTLAEDPVDGCAEASSATERAKWGNPPIVTMGQCDETLCWTCHMSANENKKPGESIETPDNFHSATIVDMMWNCQRCHVID